MPDLPTGTVSFVFTDIEGSTSLWQDHPAAMPGIIVRHDAILKELFRARGGVVFRTVGDAIHVAFRTASEALEAAVAAQRVLVQEPWGEGISLRVRMGIHTGAVDVQGGEYVGHTLNRVARISGAANGGQILLSAATAELVRDALPTGATLRDLGEHHLRDLALPERIFTVDVVDLPTDSRPIKTRDAPQTNLPSRRAALVGRDGDLEAAKHLLTREDVSLLTFTGAGGTGKTSLALAAGHAVLGDFRDGVWFVSLAPVADSALVASAIMSALGLREAIGLTVMQVLEKHFTPKQALLILDNFEQVAAAAPLIAELLAAAPGLTVLVTSRVALHLREERELPIAPLALPDRESQDFARCGAIQLFVARAQEVKPAFKITEENAPAVLEICSRLDGLPLAIELAAARIKVLAPHALLARLEKRLPLLRGGGLDLPARQQTMESAIAWSYELLTEAERSLYRRLSVFGRGFTLDQAQAICTSGVAELDLLESIISLVDKSLVRVDDVDGESRFSMLQTIQEYGLERLIECGEAAHFQRRHADYFARLSEELEREAYALGSSQVYAKTEAEWNNLRAALNWSLGDPGDTTIAVRLVAAVGWFWLFGAYAAEGRSRVTALLARPDLPGSGDDWAGALTTIATLNLQQGKYEDAMKYLATTESLLGGSSNHLQVAKLSNWLAITAQNRGDMETAQRLFVESREHARLAGLPWSETTAASFVAETLIMQGALSEGRQQAQEALTAFHSLRDPWGVGRMEVLLAAVAWLEGAYDAANTYCTEAVRHLRQVGEPYNASRATTLLGIILVAQAKYADAERVLTESLLSWRAIGNRGGVVLSLAGLAATAAGQGQFDRARRFYAALQTNRTPNALLLDRLMETGFDRFMTCVQERLGDMAADHAVPIALDDAINEAIDAASTKS